MERSLYIEKFRNLGITESQKFILNRSLEKGKLGNLIILIGENNSGKSNVLDAIEEFGENKLQERDRTLLDYSPKSQTPKLTLSCKVSDNEFYSFSFDEKGNTFPKHTVDAAKKELPYKLTKQIITNFLNAIQAFKNNYGSFNNSEIDKLIEQLKLFKDPIDAEKTEPIIQALFNNIDYSIRRRWGDHYRQRLINFAPSNSIMSYYSSTISDSGSKTEAIKKEFLQRFKVPFIPSIYRYKEHLITTRDLSNDRNSDFIKVILKAINVSPEEIEAVFERAKSTGNYGALATEERKLNKKLEKVAKHFNRIYFRNVKNDDGEYRFAFKLERNAIYINLFRGDNDINLDYQSTGFRWFFNLYFNLICNSKLKAGDIIIMDEPATHLHIGGQIELRKFLKEFAIANDVTVIIATHMPSLIDLNYLDEVRVITMKSGESYIHNDFTTVNDEDPDALKPIKLSLTVSNHMLFDPDKKVIFVEGITDYNYMTAFKRIFGIEDIIFLPINGVGNVARDLQGKHTQIVKSLQSIRKHNPVLMVDGDAAGKSMQEFCNKNKTELKVFTLEQVDANFKTIESLFTATDLTAHKLKAANGSTGKSSSTSSILKTFSGEADFSKTTLANFKKLFTYINAL